MPFSSQPTTGETPPTLNFAYILHLLEQCDHAVDDGDCFAAVPVAHVGLLRLSQQFQRRRVTLEANRLSFAAGDIARQFALAPKGESLPQLVGA